MFIKYSFVDGLLTKLFFRIHSNTRSRVTTSKAAHSALISHKPPELNSCSHWCAIFGFNFDSIRFASFRSFCRMRLWSWDGASRFVYLRTVDFFLNNFWAYFIWQQQRMQTKEILNLAQFSIVELPSILVFDCDTISKWTGISVSQPNPISICDKNSPSEK